MFRRRPSNVSSASSAPPSGGLSLRGRGAPPSFSSNESGAPKAAPVLIQRLIILHDGLVPLPPAKSQYRQTPRRRRDPELSEGASLEEHGEFILYYYDHSLHFSGEGSVRRRTPTAYPGEARRRDSNESNGAHTRAREDVVQADHATEEAVRFAGLCRALRSLPLALRAEEMHASNNEGELSETDVVHLKESTLVFVPLELGGDVTAIAQIPRADISQTTRGNAESSQGRSSSVGFGADPTAIREAIRRIHTTFSLLLGGGIHRRLLRTKHLEASKDWVLEVIEDDFDDKRDEASVSSNSCLKVKDDIVWEVDNQHQELPKHNGESKKKKKKRSRRRSQQSKSLKRLTSSVNSISSTKSANSADIGQARTSNIEEDNIGDYRYGGMKELFDLRREHRKLSNKLKEEDHPAARFGGLERNASRWGSNSNAEDLFNDIANDMGHNDCERRIDNLLRLLPITNLREDLVEFYDERLGRLQGMCEAMRGGAGRCVVEKIPPPITRGDGNSTIHPVRGQHPPLSPNAFVSLAAAEFMKSLMHQHDPKSENHCRLVGMSLFFEGRQILSETNPSNSDQTGEDAISPEIPNIIAEHFLSTQKAQSGKATQDETTQNDVNEPPPLVRWMSGLSVGAGKNEAVAEEAKLSASGSSQNASLDSGLGFVQLSLRDANELLESLYVRTIKRRVWLPRIHLPHTVGNGDEPETHVSMFEGGELSFLLFFEVPNMKGEDNALACMAQELQPKAGKRHNGKGKSVGKLTQAFADMLALLSGELHGFCQTYSSHDADLSSETRAPVKEDNSDGIFPGERGMDIICVDRDDNCFVLLSQHDLSSNDIKRVAPKADGGDKPNNNGLKPILGLFGGAKLKDESSHQEKLYQPSKYTNMLDCRHKLAAYLPLDVLLAFDDMFNEIGSKRNRDDAPNFSLDGTEPIGSIELCTFLPQGWVYGRAFGNVELYILLDTSKFVTINDVQKATTRVRERLLNDKMR